MKSKFSENSMHQLHVAIENNDLEKVIDLFESGEAGVSNIECAMAVRFNSLKVLEYFLQNISEVPRVLSYGLERAVSDCNMEAIEIILTAFRINKYNYKFMDAIILGAIEQAIFENKQNSKNAGKALKLVKFIVDNYFE